MGIVTSHPTDETLRLYRRGELDLASSRSVGNHLEGCAACRRRFAEISPNQAPDRPGGHKEQPAQPAGSVADSATVTDRRRRLRALPPVVATVPPGLAEHPDYEVVRELGRGGMGVVYLVQNKLMGRLGGAQGRRRALGRTARRARPVPPRGPVGRQAATQEYRHRLLGHAARREHRPCHGVRRGGRPGEGGEVRRPAAGGRTPATSSTRRRSGLQHAHERGMVHRDIKPANLILAREGKKAVVKVLDFGLAKVTSEGQADSGLTREGQMLGTPDFIAPEQIRDAQSADIRADIYSLGCTFYYSPDRRTAVPRRAPLGRLPGPLFDGTPDR